MLRFLLGLAEVAATCAVLAGGVILTAAVMFAFHIPEGYEHEEEEV